MPASKNGDRDRGSDRPRYSIRGFRCSLKRFFCRWGSRDASVRMERRLRRSGLARDAYAALSVGSEGGLTW